jgi:hypothetical protein
MQWLWRVKLTLTVLFARKKILTPSLVLLSKFEKCSQKLDLRDGSLSVKMYITY